MVIPRGWTFAQKQRSEAQISSSAIPAALDARFKAGSLLAICCLAVTVFRLAYSSRVYHVQIPGILLQVVLLVAIRLAYMLAGSWVWQISPYRLDVNIGWLYGLGYAPILLILYLLNLRGYLNENEERILIAQRASRGEGDTIRLEPREYHVGSHPQKASALSWWSGSRGMTPYRSQSSNPQPSPNSEGFSTGTLSTDLHASGDESGQSWWQRRKQEEVDTTRKKSQPDGGPSWSHSGEGSSGNTLVTQRRWVEKVDSSIRTASQTRPATDGDKKTSSTHSLQSRPQAVRSMLDV